MNGRSTKIGQPGAPIRRKTFSKLFIVHDILAAFRSQSQPSTTIPTISVNPSTLLRNDKARAELGPIARALLRVLATEHVYDLPGVTLEFYREIKEAAGVPVLGLGGINIVKHKTGR